MSQQKLKRRNGLTMKEAASVESCYFQPQYAGEQSAKFWKEVRDLANDRTLYDFACALQDLEHRVLAVLNTSVRVRARKLILQSRARRRRSA